MNGFASDLGIYREASFLGLITGACYRPPGLMAARLDARPLAKFESKNPLATSTRSAPLHQAWTLTITREFSFSDYNAFILDALRTDEGAVTVAGPLTSWVRGTGADGEPQTFGACLLFPDGIRRRLRGMTPRRVELSIQSRRLITEETEWTVVVVEEETTAETITPLPQHTAVPASRATLSAVVGGELFSLATFSAQLIIERDLKACQYDSDGEASRIAINGGWEMLGRCVMRLGADLNQVLGRVVPAEITITITSGDESLAFSVPTATAIVSGQPFVERGQLDNTLDFQALDGGAGLFTTTETRPT